MARNLSPREIPEIRDIYDPGSWSQSDPTPQIVPQQIEFTARIED